MKKIIGISSSLIFSIYLLSSCNIQCKYEDHKYGEAEYSWSSDYSKCTASRTCKKCNFLETEETDSTKEITQEKNCINEEYSTFKVNFDNPNFESQIIENIKTSTFGEHSFGESFLKFIEGYPCELFHQECIHCHKSITIDNENKNILKEYKASRIDKIYTSDEGLFKCKILNNINYDSLNIKIYKNETLINDYEISFEETKNEFDLQLQEEENYEIIFTPKINKFELKSFSTFPKFVKKSNINIPVIEINSLNNEYVKFDQISAPSGCWGGGTINNEYVNCNISLTNSNKESIYEENSYGGKYKIRGNTSAGSSKPGYKIKLPSKEDLLNTLITRKNGKIKDKIWNLIKLNNFNHLFGRIVDDLIFDTNEYDVQMSIVTLYINGNYEGIYGLTDNIDEKHIKLDNDNPGFIIEDDAYWWNEDLSFGTNLINVPTKYTFKYPDSDDINEQSPEFIYAKDILKDFENQLVNEDGDPFSKLNLNSAVNWLLVHDVLGTWDSGGSNIFIYKIDNSTSTLISFGPTWDYDSIFGLDGLARIRWESHFYYPYLLQNETFNNAYKTKFNLLKDTLCANLQSKFDNLGYQNKVSQYLIDKKFNNNLSNLFIKLNERINNRFFE